MDFAPLRLEYFDCPAHVSGCVVPSMRKQCCIHNRWFSVRHDTYSERLEEIVPECGASLVLLQLYFLPNNVDGSYGVRSILRARLGCLLIAALGHPGAYVDILCFCHYWVHGEGFVVLQNKNPSYFSPPWCYFDEYMVFGGAWHAPFVLYVLHECVGNGLVGE